MNKLLPSIITMMCLLCFTSCEDEFVTENCLPSDLQSDVIMYFDFNKGSLMNRANPGLLVNNTSANSTMDRVGNSNCAYLFDNTGADEEFLIYADTDKLNNLNSFSISAWYMPRASSSSELQGLVSRNDTISTSCPNRRGEWSLSLYDCKKAVFGHDNSAWANLDINAQFDCDEQVALLDNAWHHAVAVKDDNEYKIYYNGVLSETVTGDGQCNNLRKSQDIGDLFLGKNYTGAIDDVIIYKKALSDSEVQRLFQVEVCCE